MVVYNNYDTIRKITLHSVVVIAESILKKFNYI